VYNNGTFMMVGGTISGNTASSGGGVYAYQGINKTGGIIYGSDGGGNSNIATNGDGYGHAVYGPSTTFRDSTWE
jgi:hypothetical protein